MTAIIGAAAAFYPTAATTVQLYNATIFESGTGSVGASYTIATDGHVTGASGGLDTWLFNGLAANYEVRATLTSGALTTGTTGSWIALSSDRTWTLINSASDNSVRAAAMLVEIRASASPATILASATITLEAESDNFN